MGGLFMIYVVKDIAEVLFYVFAFAFIGYEEYLYLNAERLVKGQKILREVGMKNISYYSTWMKTIASIDMAYCLWWFAGLFTSYWYIVALMVVVTFVLPATSVRRVKLNTVTSILLLSALLVLKVIGVYGYRLVG